MRFSVLASGSTGNSIYVETDETRILIDAGISGKQLEQRLKQIGTHPSQLTAILVSHEHGDHVKGLGVLARRYQLPIYMNEATWNRLPASVGEIPLAQQNTLTTGTTFAVDRLIVESIPISHDAAEPIGFRLNHQQESLGIITDLGYVNQRLIEKIRGTDTLIWESNHDVEMLRIGKCPWNVKRRILGDLGHLSNQDAGEALVEILKGQGEQIYLAHLSLDNNLSELAGLTVKNILQNAGCSVGRDVQLWETYPYKPTPLREVKRKQLEKLTS